MLTLYMPTEKLRNKPLRTRETECIDRRGQGITRTMMGTQAMLR